LQQLIEGEINTYFAFGWSLSADAGAMSSHPTRLADSLANDPKVAMISSGNGLPGQYVLRNLLKL
jgi:hypothetical protein